MQKFLTQYGPSKNVTKKEMTPSNLTVVGLSCKTKGKNLSWQKAQQWVFSTVYVRLQAVYTTAEKEFRSIAVFGLRWHIKAPIRHKRWNNMLFHPVLYKGNGLQSRVLFHTFRIGIRFQIIHIARCESLRIEQDFIKCSCQPKKLFFWHSSKYERNGLQAKLTWRYLLHSYFDVCQKNEIHILYLHYFRSGFH